MKRGSLLRHLRKSTAAISNEKAANIPFGVIQLPGRSKQHLDTRRFPTSSRRRSVEAFPYLRFDCALSSPRITLRAPEPREFVPYDAVLLLV
jgi:hypothetical protein